MHTVTLYIRPTVEGKRKYVPADPKLKNNQGTFHLRFTLNGKQVWETTRTKIYTFALAAAKQKESSLILHESKATPDLPRPKVRLTLVVQRDNFLELKELTKKPDGTRLDKETISAYRQETEKFLSVAKKTYADEIDGMDLRRYMSALEAAGDVHRTICNKYTSVGTFLKFCGIDHKELLPKGERPRADDGDPEAYTHEELLRFFAAVKRYRDHLYFEFELKTGARKGEGTCPLDRHCRRRRADVPHPEPSRDRLPHQDRQVPSCASGEEPVRKTAAMEGTEPRQEAHLRYTERQAGYALA
jgi:hypothetical protein